MTGEYDERIDFYKFATFFHRFILFSGYSFQITERTWEEFDVFFLCHCSLFFFLLRCFFSGSCVTIGSLMSYVSTGGAVSVGSCDGSV